MRDLIAEIRQVLAWWPSYTGLPSRIRESEDESEYVDGRLLMAANERAYQALTSIEEQLEATEQHANEIRQLAHRQGETIYDMTIQLASLRHALTQVRAECDLPDYIAEFIGEALGSSEEARDVRA